MNTRPITHKPDAALDLMFERIVDVPVNMVWKAWTTPAQILKWFTPAPWKTIDCEMDLRPGGIFRTVMLSPEGAKFPNEGCFLEIVENEKLAWTNALMPGYRPRGAPPPGIAECDMMDFTAVVSLAPQGTGTKYTALVIHKDEAGRNKHHAMGFEHGWGLALDQMVAMIKAA